MKKRTKAGGLASALKRLEMEGGSRWDPEKHPYPSTLRASEIRTSVPVFQPRSLEGRLAEDEEHIRSLASVISRDQRKDKQGNTIGKPIFLDPILVWWSGNDWYVVDGHHCLLAYKQAKVTGPIPVSYFDGSLQEAIRESIRRNSKDKLIMRKDDKLNAAWKLVLTADLTIPQIVSDTTISPRQVGNMRRAKADLLTKGRTEEELLDLSWKQARGALLSNGQVKDDDQTEDLDWKAAEVMCRAICRAVGGARIIQRPDIMAKALIILESRLPGWLMESSDWMDTVRELADQMNELDEMDELEGAEGEDL